MRPKFRTVLLLLVGVLFGAPAVGTAQENGGDEEALQHHIRRAVDAVKAERFERAADHYLDAHAISPQPILLYNAAYALGRAGRLKRALDVSERASEGGLDNPKASARNRARRTGWSTAMATRRRAEAASRTAGATGPRPDAAPRQPAAPPAAEWLGAGTMVAGGGILVGAALLDAQIGREAGRLHEASERDDAEAYRRARENIDSLQRGGRILIVGGSTLIAGGATLVLWGLLGGDGGETALVPTVAPDGSVSIQLRGNL